jgi:hypothetical protein
MAAKKGKSSKKLTAKKLSGTKTLRQVARKD